MRDKHFIMAAERRVNMKQQCKHLKKKRDHDKCKGKSGKVLLQQDAISWGEHATGVQEGESAGGKKKALGMQASYGREGVIKVRGQKQR